MKSARTPMFSLHVDTGRFWRHTEQQVLLTVLGLRALGHRAALVADPRGELLRRAAEGHDLVPMAPRTEVDFASAWRLSRVIQRLQPQIVHAHDPHGIASAALALSLGHRKPSPVLVAARRALFRIKRNSFSRWKYRQVDFFIANCEAIRHALVASEVSPDRVTTVYDGIDVERVVSIPGARVQAEFWLPTAAPIVGNIAALVPHNGHRHLIDAAALVIRDIPDARFVILGEGPLRSALEEQVARHGLGKHVVLPGFRADALAMHKGFDLFVTGASVEGLSQSVLDAMASARAVVATRVGGMPETVADGETGLLVEPRDARAMAGAIVRLLQDEGLRRRMGTAGLKRVRATFSAERMVRETLAAYGRTAGRHRGVDTASHALSG